MNPSARVALIAALATTAPTWASLPFYSPDYTYDPATGGYQYALFGGGITPDGKAAADMEHFVVGENDYLIVTWRGQTPLPTPQQEDGHFNPGFGGMNRYGWICGKTDLSPGGAFLPALWRPDGTRIDLPLIPASLNSFQGTTPEGVAFDVSDAGFVVGWSDNYDSLNIRRTRPVYWTPTGEIIELASPFMSSDQYWDGDAASISANGIIAGRVYYQDGSRVRWHAMRWDIDGTAPILSQTTNTGITFTWGTEAFKSLNDGTILGWGSIVDHSAYGVLWTPDGDAIDLRALPDSNSQSNRYAYDVNNNHYSAGLSYNTFGQMVGTRWSPTGEPFALDRLADAPSNARDNAEGINDFNFVVGTTWAGDDYRRVILWTPEGDAIDLQSLVDSDEWSFIRATTITNTGWIAGFAYYDPAGPAEAYFRPFSILVPFAGTYGMGDANFDESIDFADLLIVAQNYGSETNGSFDVGDFNLDGSVDFTDLLAIAQNYGVVTGDVFTLLPNSPNPTFESDWQTALASVPEPTTVSALLAGLLVLIRRR